MDDHIRKAILSNQQRAVDAKEAERQAVFHKTALLHHIKVLQDLITADYGQNIILKRNIEVKTTSSAWDETSPPSNLYAELSFDHTSPVSVYLSWRGETTREGRDSFGDYVLVSTTERSFDYIASAVGFHTMSLARRIAHHYDGRNTSWYSIVENHGGARQFYPILIAKMNALLAAKS